LEVSLVQLIPNLVNGARFALEAGYSPIAAMGTAWFGLGWIDVAALESNDYIYVEKKYAHLCDTN